MCEWARARLYIHIYIHIHTHTHTHTHTHMPTYNKVTNSTVHNPTAGRLSTHAIS